MIDIALIGGAEVVAKLDRIPPKMREELKNGIGRLALKLQRNVQREKLSGQVLKVRTGRLRRSIAETVIAQGDTVSGIVSTAVVYAPIHEYGFQGTQSVRESVRTIKQAFGRPISPMQVTVRAHERKVNLPERSFLRSALRDMEASGVIGEEINAAAARALT